MPNKIKPKRSYTANSVPLTTDLEAHELAINWADGVAYTKNASGQIVSVPLGGSGGGGGGVSWASVPASATAAGTAGQIAYDADYLYLATATNTWKRAALSTWSSFTPATIAGLQLWLDASDASTLYDATSGGSLVAADGSVARWEDKSGNARHATQGTSGKRPTRKTSVQNGRDALRLSSSAFLTSMSLSANDWTFFFAVKPSTATSGSRFYFDASVGRLIAAQVQGNTTEPGWYDGTWKSGDAVTTSAQVLTWRLAAAGATLYRNGTSIVSGSYTQKAIGGDVCLFAENNTDYDHANGDVFEVLMYQGALSLADREAVENYLLEKWAIS